MSLRLRTVQWSLPDRQRGDTRPLSAVGLATPRNACAVCVEIWPPFFELSPSPPPFPAAP